MKTFLVRYIQTVHTEIRVKARNKDAAVAKADVVLADPDGREGQITFNEPSEHELYSITEEL